MFFLFLSDCTCDYRGQNCKAYCQLLQPVGHASELGCSHWSHRPHTRDGDALRELNRCCVYARELGPDTTRPSRIKGISECSYVDDRVLRRGMMHHSEQRPANVRFCNLRDGEWNSACVLKSGDQRVSRRNTGAGDHWSNHSMTFEERDRYSADLREKYIQEMEALKAKLNMLKNGVLLDGKRIRQRSESEPGISSFIGRQHKRARDASPCCHKASNTTFQREARSVPPRMPVSRLYKPVMIFFRISDSLLASLAKFHVLLLMSVTQNYFLYLATALGWSVGVCHCFTQPVFESTVS